MKRVLCILLTVVMVSTVVGCASGGGSASPAYSTPESAAPGGNEPPGGPDIIFGHLAYHTGGFGFHGPQFDGSVNLAITEANQLPPLGRTIAPANHVDVGTLGEGDSAKRLLDADKSDILYNTAGQYGTYREWLQEYITANDAPIMPSIHGGAVPDKYGGIATEPLFRGEPQTSFMAMSMLLDFYDQGGRSLVIVASDREEMMKQREYTIEAAEILGIEVLGVVVIQAGEASYRAEAAQVVALNPDGVIQFSHAGNSGTFLANATALGMTDKLYYVETNSAFDPFLEAATIESIMAQKLVKWPTIAVANNPAYAHFKNLWETQSGVDATSHFRPNNYYVTSSWDILMLTFLAIEKAGSTNASAWVPAMYEVAAKGGEVVYTYVDGINALREGKDIQYVGVTGEINFSDTGTIMTDWSLGTWNDNGTPNYENMSVIPRQRMIDLISQLKTEWSWDQSPKVS